MNKAEYINNVYNLLRMRNIVRSQKDFAKLVGTDPTSMSKAMSGFGSYANNIAEKVETYLAKGEFAIPADWVQDFPSLDAPSQEEKQPELPAPKATLPVIPIEAMAGTLGDFARSAAMYDCEMMVSPIKGADYAMKVSGDSMSPEYPNGSQILIKKVNEKAFIEWGKVYVLDTANGAVIKQIRKTDKEGVVECVSLNPDYQPFTIDTSFINGWYRVLMVLALK